VPLHGLGMSHWMWGRFPFRDREAIYYVLWPHGESRPRHCLGVEVGVEGETRRIPGLRLETEEPRRTLGGIPWARRLRIVHGDRPWLQVRHTHLVDSGPFYLRMISEGVAADGESVTGFGELCYPDRVDLGVHRPFVRMCVQRVAGGNSPWLPLFTGPRHGRVGRLLGHLLPGTR
jgi:carotenoid 1,2-hydratase